MNNLVNNEDEELDWKTQYNHAVEYKIALNEAAANLLKKAIAMKIQSDHIEWGKGEDFEREKTDLKQWVLKIVEGLDE